ncbi:MAG TPA: serine/threonine-protein kinase [Burkholderiales bacterium]|nr:serine/threonine-protein kinase [Burkholderiales bacterium]
MQQIGKFQLRRVLGKGASGTVYLALDTFFGKDVALKVLDREVVASPDFERTVTAQFLNEASLAGKLKHPHIAEILEASVSRESGYIALEYVPGGDLTQYVQPGKLLTPEQAIQVAFKCCGALDYAFRQGIVHRDIKPANIMVVSGTNIKVADFGAAYLKTGPEKPATGEAGEVFGSPYYMSPEQVAGQELGVHSDMFALGVVLYELFTGKRPFVGASLEELFAKIANEPAAAPSSVRGEIRREVDEILLRMLGKKPADRYASWAEAALDLAKAGRLTLSQKTIADSDKFQALRKVPVLERLNDAEIWELVHAGAWSRVPARTAIVKEGDEGRSLFFLGSGHVKVMKGGRLLNMLNAGECFGEMAYIKEGGMVRQATIEAGDDALVAEFNPDMLAKASINCRLQLTTALLHMVVDRLAVANQRIAAQK